MLCFFTCCFMSDHQTFLCVRHIFFYITLWNLGRELHFFYITLWNLRRELHFFYITLWNLGMLGYEELSIVPGNLVPNVFMLHSTDVYYSDILDICYMLLKLLGKGTSFFSI